MDTGTVRSTHTVKPHTKIGWQMHREYICAQLKGQIINYLVSKPSHSSLLRKLILVGKQREKDSKWY